MGRFIRIGLAATLTVLLFAGWHSFHAATVDPSPFRQIYIHETPVCVYQDGENVLARIGMCPDSPGEESENPPGTAPFHGRPRMELPPGHPPVDEGPAFDEKRTTIPI